ncbi:hypothetical protein F4692_000882 [Nocardioides cavernae]|uniref:Uncharacterized protein n=1 Tax=Nocardioides cavernae TaxID=1921566 RepID=A0A7Y9H106_9ACTN|nr:DUF6541 family protein [Nocardioides cavernae]NYE35778.1 hypothetical protein [Nocardioides cavernae]
MDPSTTVDWSGALVPVLVAAVVLLAPGLVVAKALGLDLFDALGVAAPLGLAVLLVGGTAADLVGLGWSMVGGVLVLLVVTAVGAVLARLLTRRDPEPAPAGSSHWTAWGFAGGVAAATVATGWKVVHGTTRADAVSQMPDIQFHLQAVDQLVQQDSASPLKSGDVWFYDPISYPGGLHSLAATVASWTGAEVVVASQTVLLVCAALVWPLGMVALVRRVVSPNGWVLAAAGLISLSLFYAPVALLSLGGAWANLVAASLVPGALIPLALATMRPTRPPARVVVAAALAFGAAALAAALAQPNAAYTIAVLALGLTAPTVLTWGRWWVLGFVGVLVVVVAAWIVPRQPAMFDVPVVPDLSTRRAVLLLLKNGDVPLWAGGVLALLTLAGVGIALVSRAWRGVAVAWAVTFAFALLLQFGDRLPVTYLTWPWWSGYARIANMLGVAVVLAGCVTVATIVRQLERVPRWASVGGGVLGLAIVAVVAVPATTSVQDSIRDSYFPRDTRFYYATADELVDLRTLADELEPGSIVAMDPFGGGGFLNLMGPRTVPIGPFYEGTPETDLVDARLDEAASDDDVCAAVADLGITHVLTGGDEVMYYSWLEPTYEGIEAVPGSAGFSMVAEAGDYELWAVPPACAPTS